MVDSLIYENKILTLMTIALVEKDRVFDVCKIHSLPLLHPSLKKQIKFKFESPYMAISHSKLFAIYPSLDEILTCQMVQGSYCEINKPLFTIDKTKQCAIYLFNQQRSQINKYCKIDFINQTTDFAMLLDNSYWVTSTIKPTCLHMSCLTTSYYKQLKYSLDITYLGDSCEGFTASMLLPASNVVKNNDPIQIHGNMESFTQLNYSSVHDFTVFKDITITKINDSMGTAIPDIPDIPDIKDTTIMALNQQLTNILTDYLWELPLWSKIIIMAVLTLLTIVVLIKCHMCHQHGSCLME